MIWPPPMLLPKGTNTGGGDGSRTVKDGGHIGEWFARRALEEYFCAGLSFGVGRLTIVDLPMLGVFYSTWRLTMVDSVVYDAGAPGR